MQKKRSLGTALASLLRSPLPEGTRGGPTEIALCGRRQIEIALCKGICAYGREKISVYVKEGRLTVTGEGLTLKTYRDRRIAITGKIGQVLFEDA